MIMGKFNLTSTDVELAAQVADLINLGGQQVRPVYPATILNNDVIYCVQVVGDRVIGVCGISNNYQRSEIKHLVVSPDYRGKSIGNSLVEKTIDKSTNRCVYATVRYDNFNSIRIMVRNYFKVTNLTNGSVKPLINFVRNL